MILTTNALKEKFGGGLRCNLQLSAQLTAILDTWGWRRRRHWHCLFKNVRQILDANCQRPSSRSFSAQCNLLLCRFACLCVARAGQLTTCLLAVSYWRTPQGHGLVTKVFIGARETAQLRPTLGSVGFGCIRIQPVWILLLYI